MKESEYWFNNLDELFDCNKLDRFIPTSEMSYIEKTNALVRLGIYVGLLVFVFTKNYLYLYIPLGMMVFTYVMFLLRKVDKESDDKIKDVLNTNNINNFQDTKDEFSNLSKVDDGLDFKYRQALNQKRLNKEFDKPCVNSTPDNPFMNPSPMSPRNIGKPCSPLMECNKRIIEKNFNKGLFKDANDIFNTRNGFRQFYTVPGNTFPNNRDTYMKWLYYKPDTCKSGSGEQCFKNIH